MMIFSLTMEGFGPYQIAELLTQQKIEIPSVHLARHGEGVNKSKTFKDPCGWGSSTIAHILKKREYLGHTVNFKTRKHFKDKKSHYVDENEWTIFENTHEPIIDQETFDNAQRIRSNVRRYPDGFGELQPLTGLMYCADCGGKMYVHRTSNGKRTPQYTCSRYSKVPVGKLCPTQHRINGEVALTAEEQEGLRKKEERKDRLHQNYLRRKANGKQREYEERTKSEKRKKMEKKKAALQAEDMAKGVYILTGSLPHLEPQLAANSTRTATL